MEKKCFIHHQCELALTGTSSPPIVGRKVQEGDPSEKRGYQWAPQWACGQDTGEVCASLWSATRRAGPPKLPGILKSPGGQLETLAGSPPTPEGATPPPAGNRQNERRTSSPGPPQEEEEEEKESNRKSEVFQQKSSPLREGLPVLDRPRPVRRDRHKCSRQLGVPLFWFQHEEPSL